MKPAAVSHSVFIGWDVGGWNCDNNSKSRKAIVILDDTLTIIGQPWRGNLRECIATTTTTSYWLNSLFVMCKAEFPAGTVTVMMAIDTAPGFFDELVRLVTGQSCVDSDETSRLNRYLSRHTQRHLLE